MYENYKKECYDTNPHYKVHYSHGVQKYNEKLNHLHYDKDLVIEYFRKGTTSKRIEGNIYSISEGDIVITTPAELHIPLRTEDCYIEKISIHINESLLSVFGGDQTVFFAKIVNKEKGVGNIIVADIVRELGLDKELDQCLRYAEDFSLESQVLSILWNFTLNRRYTFKSAANVPVAMTKVFGFYLVFTPLSTYLGDMAEGVGVNDFIILIVTMVANFVLEFLFCKFVVYWGKEDTMKK